MQARQTKLVSLVRRSLSHARVGPKGRNGSTSALQTGPTGVFDKLEAQFDIVSSFIAG